jgi:geranylgeranyl pyrophosphate synthase
MWLERIQQRLVAVPEVGAWPDLEALIRREVERPTRPAWAHPAAACCAVGGEGPEALPAAAAVYCSLLALHLVDDLLDDEPRGDFHRLGAGGAANLALALLALAHRMLDEADAAPEVGASLHRELAGLVLATSLGQALDASEIEDEEAYWRLVRAKTPPLFAAAWSAGARLGGASAALAGSLAKVGGKVGELVQVSDDLADALRSPAAPDWRRPRNNLALLYGLTAEHPDRARLAALCPRAGEPEALCEAQAILARCGAVSFAAYKLIELAAEAHRMLDAVPLAERRHLGELIDEPIAPVYGLLGALGIEDPEALVLEQG